jgi:hypothetical protein
MSRKREDIGRISRKDLVLEIVKRRVEPSRKINVRILYRGRPPPKREKSPLTIA